MKIRIFKYIIIGLVLSSFMGDDCDFIADYYQTVYQAEIHYLKNENQKALFLLKQAEKKCGLLNQIGMYEPIMMAELLVRTKKEKKAFPYLHRILEDGLPYEMLENNPEFNILHNYKEWNKLKIEAPEILAKFNKSINQDLRNEIIKMIIEDQKVRTGNIDFAKMRIVDSINESRIKEIFTEYGYPNFKLIGHSFYSEPTTDISAMLMHFHDTVFFKPRLLEFIKKGEAPPSTYSAMIDSRQRSIGIFTYGAYQNIDSTKIKDFENIDVRRKSIGLRSYKLEKEYWRLIRKKYNVPEE